MAISDRTCFDCYQFYGNFYATPSGEIARLYCDLGLIPIQRLSVPRDIHASRVAAMFGTVCPRFERCPREDHLATLLTAVESIMYERR